MILKVELPTEIIIINIAIAKICRYIFIIHSFQQRQVPHPKPERHMNYSYWLNLIIYQILLFSLSKDFSPYNEAKLFRE
ncbi:hypothetical protein FGO68_gene15466 [Halteria grandinella]|uniref:Uncharacterized protein n=1 Tax=Halteria grandinella TaxID=5974 RepID=A0A8J8NG33_HALGN|nr:hypothetical protein FGO68_gene15466 [Halteria grandinella]